MDALVLLAAGKNAAQLAQAVGLIEDRLARALEAVAADVRKLAEAPLREGIRRLQQAAVADSEHRRSMPLAEARCRFEDAAARDLDPVVHATALVLLCEAWPLLNEQTLATGVARETVLAAERAHCEADYLWQTGPMISRPWRPVPPRPDERPFRELAGDAVDLCLGLEVDLTSLIINDDVDYNADDPEFDFDAHLLWIDEEFIAERRRGLKER